MKIAVCSDLHLEFDRLDPSHHLFKNVEGADVLILGGDILVAATLKEGSTRSHRQRRDALEFLNTVCKIYKHVVYIMGNHEHYEGDFKYTSSIIHATACKHDNLHFLDNQSVEIDGVTFIGGTMWTDMNKEDPDTLFFIRRRMNDFVGVQNSNRMVQRRVPLYAKNPDGSGTYLKDANGYYIKEGEKFKEEPSTFSPEDAVEEHKKFIGVLRETLVGKDKVVVCTHHTPTYASCHPRYADDKIMNGGYHSDLSDLILDNPQIKLWTHGHTHDRFDYMVGTTRVVCNPRGYSGYESIADRFLLQVVEV
jgi:Icc-related predicted phosphoesterase